MNNSLLDISFTTELGSLISFLQEPNLEVGPIGNVMVRNGLNLTTEVGLALTLPEEVNGIFVLKNHVRKIAISSTRQTFD